MICKRCSNASRAAALWCDRCGNAFASEMKDDQVNIAEVLFYDRNGKWVADRHFSPVYLCYGDALTFTAQVQSGPKRIGTVEPATRTESEYQLVLKEKKELLKEKDGLKEHIQYLFDHCIAK